jgi:hypothetical protein
MNGMKYATFWNGGRRFDILLSEVEAVTYNDESYPRDTATIHTRSGAAYDISLDDSGFFESETDDNRNADMDALAASIFCAAVRSNGK